MGMLVEEAGQRMRSGTWREREAMNHSTDRHDAEAVRPSGSGGPGGSRVVPEGPERSGDVDSVLLGRREAGREELLERLCSDQVRRWRGGQRAPAETYLAMHPRIRDDDEAAFEVIYSEYLLREELGETPSAEELQWRFPRFAERLERQVALHEVLHSGEGEAAPTGPGGAPEREAEDGPEPGGPFVAPGFRILGELGRGGMGAVYKAWQVRLKRTVAIKVIRADAYADAGAAARFQAEAEAAARFQHPHIVQVYEVGEHEGMGYLVLEYAAGGGLDRLLAESLQDPRDSARLIETLARAIHFAHQRGIIHRDLKPANVLLTEEGIPKITDFGLAKLLEREDALTREGEILGTPSYMAPEQIRGLTGEITPATDVYSLGAILYETLTGRPPFKGTTPLSTLEQVAGQDPLPPGKIHGHLPRDLETICLKCLAKEPRCRYATALELAEDLARFLDGQPILARPTPAWDRASKWARRRPGIAAAVAGLIGLSLLLIGGGLYYNHRLREEMLTARNAHRRAAVERNLALKTLNQLIYDVQERLAPTPATRSLRRSLLDTAIRGLDEIGRSTEGASPDLSQAVAYQKLGDIYRIIGQTSAARLHYGRALRIAEPLLDVTPRDAAIQDVLYHAHMGLGLVDRKAKQFDDAKLGFRRAVAMAESIAAAKPGQDAPRRGLIEAYLELGRAFSFAGEFPAAEEWFRKMHDEAMRWVSEDPGQKQARDLLASALRKLADLRKFARDFAEARRAYTRAIEIDRELVAAEPGNEPYTTHLAIALDDLAGVEKQEGRLGAARDLFGQAEQLFTRLVAADPENLESRMRLLHTRYKTAKLDREEARYREAREALVQIRQELQVLAREGRLEGQPGAFADDHTLEVLIDACADHLRKSE
jgi:serine/threonine protein kinase